MDKKVSTLFAVLGIALLGGFLAWTFYFGDKNRDFYQELSSKEPAVKKQDAQISPLDKLAQEKEQPEVSGLKISTPLKNKIIQSPLVIKGEARGPWFFEGEFLVKIMDGRGNFLATGLAIA